LSAGGGNLLDAKRETILTDGAVPTTTGNKVGLKRLSPHNNRGGGKRKKRRKKRGMKNSYAVEQKTQRGETKPSRQKRASRPKREERQPPEKRGKRTSPQ